MARIQDPLAEQRPVARQGGGIARMSARGPSEAPGQAVMQLGQDIGAAGEEIYRAQKIEEDRINALRSEDAFTKLRQRQLDLTVADGGFARLQGEAAVTRPIRQEYLKRFDDAEQEFEKTLSNDEQRARYKSRAKVARLQYDEEILRHLAQQSDVYAKQVFEGVITQAQQDASVRWDSPLDVASSLERIRSQVFERAERYDWAPEYRDSVLKEQSGKVHSTVIGQALANGNYRYAQLWYEENKDHVTPETQRALARAVVDGTQREMTAGFNARFLADRENRAGLEKLAQEVVGSDLDETRKNIVHGRILNRIDALDNRAERERLQQERVIGKLIGDANANTLAGMPSTIEQLGPIYEASKGTPLEPEARQMVAIANATGTFSRLNPVEQAEAITRAETAARADPTKFDRRVLEAWKSIYSSQQTLLGKDPVTFAVRQGIAETQPLDLSQPAAAGEVLAGRFGLARSMQAKYGAPMRPLTEPEAQLVSRALEGAGWKEKRDYLGGLFQAARGDVQGYSGIMAQISQDHPLTALAGEYQAKGRTQAADLILQGEAILKPDQKGGALLALPPEGDMKAEFDSTVRDAYAGRPGLRKDMERATRAIYVKLASDKGVKDTKILDGDLWEQAVALATGGIGKHNSRMLPMPYGMDEDTFEDEVVRRSQDLETAGMLPEGVSAAQLQGLQLEPVGDGKYAFLTGTGILVNTPAPGQPVRPVVLDFNQSRAYRPSGYGKSQSEDLHQAWMRETGGALQAGENTQQAMQRWARERGRAAP